MVKYRWIHYDNTEAIGSGWSRIEGNVRQDIHVQFTYQF
jgi:hypothetical protein